MAVIGACTASARSAARRSRPPRPSARAALPELRRYRYDAGLRDRHDRGRRHARHPDPALGHPRRLRDLDRAEHRQAVHGGARSRACSPRSSTASSSRSWCGAIPSSRRRIDAGRRGATRVASLHRRLAGAARRLRRRRRHLWRRLHADRGRRGRRHRDARWSASLQRTLGWREIKASLIQTAETSAHDLRDPARRRGVQRLPRAVAAADAGRRAGRRRSACRPMRSSSALLVFYILLGAVMDELAMILLTLPVFFPIVHGARFRHAARRGRDLVRHPGADRRRHRPHRAADRAQRLRGQRDRARRADRRDLSRRAAASSSPTSIRLALCVAFPAVASSLVRWLA